MPAGRWQRVQARSYSDNAGREEKTRGRADTAGLGPAEETSHPRHETCTHAPEDNEEAGTVAGLLPVHRANVSTRDRIALMRSAKNFRRSILRTRYELQFSVILSSRNALSAIYLSSRTRSLSLGHSLSLRNTRHARDAIVHARAGVRGGCQLVHWVRSEQSTGKARVYPLVM